MSIYLWLLGDLAPFELDLWFWTICPRSGFPDNHSQHQVYIRKFNQSETPQFIQHGIHSPIPNSTSQSIKTCKTCKTYINIPHPPLQYHYNCTILWRWMHSPVWKLQSRSKKKKANIVEGYWYPMNVLWRFLIQDPFQGNQQSNMISNITIKQWSQHIKTMAPQHARSYHPTPQQELAIFYHQILFCPKNLTLILSINDGSFAKLPGITAKRITNYLPESKIKAKGILDKQKKLTVAATSVNVTCIATKEGGDSNEIILQLFDPTENKYYELTGKVPVQ